MEGLTAGGEEAERKKEEQEKGEVTEMVKVTASLNVFELKLFKEEPSLVSVGGESTLSTLSSPLSNLTPSRVQRTQTQQ